MNTKPVATARLSPGRNSASRFRARFLLPFRRRPMPKFAIGFLKSPMVGPKERYVSTITSKPTAPRAWPVSNGTDR